MTALPVIYALRRFPYGWRVMVLDRVGGVVRWAANPDTKSELREALKTAVWFRRKMIKRGQA